MDERDRGIRNRTYALLVDRGRAPSAAEMAAFEGVSREELVASWRRLDEMHALVLDPATDEIRMANPFSAVPTPYRGRARGGPPVAERAPGPVAGFAGPRAGGA